MVAQKVVTVADCDVEGHAAEQLFEVCIDMLGVAAGAQELGEFEATGALARLTTPFYSRNTDSPHELRIAF